MRWFRRACACSKRANREPRPFAPPFRRGRTAAGSRTSTSMRSWRARMQSLQGPRAGERVTEYALSQRAQSDLDEIWDYSAQRWGRDQANRYVEALRDSMERVAADPSRGRSITV